MCYTEGSESPTKGRCGSMAESKQELRERIGDLAYEVTQNAATEYAFTGEYLTELEK